MHKAKSWDLPYLESSDSGTMMVNGNFIRKKKKERNSFKRTIGAAKMFGAWKWDNKSNIRWLVW